MNDDLGLSPSHARGFILQGSADWPGVWFAQDSVARLVIARNLAVLANNRSAQALFEANNALSVRDGALAPRDRRAGGELGVLVSAARQKALCGVVGASGGAALLVEAVGLGDDADAPVALALRNLGAPVEIECSDLESMFGVTPGEHQVVVQLLKGYSSREIALQFGKSILTVRTHVKRAYGKIGVKTRGQLFARLLPYLFIR
ncbi:MAG: helix-turn-helix transcriptional regulator [Caulobacteraceae bacterium]